MARNNASGKLATYAELLVLHKPRMIDSDREHNRQLRIVDELMRRPKRTAAEARLLDLLVTLVERYDTENYPVAKSPPGRMLHFLLESRGVSQSQFATDVGMSRQLVTEIIKGRSAVSPENIRRFADYFGVAVELFVPATEDIVAP